MLMLNDNGINGDKQAGDNIWSINATYESGTEGGIRMWKYCMFYPGAEDVTAVSGAVFENEFVYTDRHHWINVLDDEPTMETNDIFNYDSNGLNSFPEESSIESEKELKPEEFKLCQNYPNPFNPTTMIEYQLPSRQLVELKVFNTLGMEVKTLVQKTQDSGKYHVLFNASKLSSGVYFCQMRVGEFTQTRKMLFLK
ncbi:MAG: T9SS type A sorting domain-containing protein [Candidatus Marinimicrobia bacterium]|nr:T9SS type A sorting domain-containing protein [Candidatus Neomarinimicrobiota bacterium]